MNDRRLDRLVEAVLYDWHLLYPCRPSARKNRQRFAFGRVYPESYTDPRGIGSNVLQLDCLLRPASAAEPDEARVQLELRFLQPQIAPAPDLDRRSRPVASAASEHSVRTTLRCCEGTLRLPFHFPGPSDTSEAAPRRDPRSGAAAHPGGQPPPLAGLLDIRTQVLPDGLRRLTARVVNRTPMPTGEPLDNHALLSRTFTATHLVLTARGARFVSLSNPRPADAVAAAACTNIGVWPVILETETGDTLFASPVVPPDAPEVGLQSGCHTREPDRGHSRRSDPLSLRGGSITRRGNPVAQP